MSAVSDEDLGYLSFEPVRSDFSTHTKVALVRGKFRPSTFYKEICQFFILDRFFYFFSHFIYFLQNFTFIYVSAIYCLVSILFLEYFELSIWKEKKRNRHGVTKLVIFMFFYEHHFFYIFARTRLLGTKVDTAIRKTLTP